MVDVFENTRQLAYTQGTYVWKAICNYGVALLEIEKVCVLQVTITNQGSSTLGIIRRLAMKGE